MPQDRTPSPEPLGRDRSILLLHGFASSPRGEKVDGLRLRLEPAGVEVIAPELNLPRFEDLRFSAMVDHAVEAAAEADLIVGSSLGAMVALEVVRRGGTLPLVLIAPAIGVGELWISRIPPEGPLKVFHHARGREVWIHRAFFEEMAGVESDRDPPATPVVIVIGDGDESIPIERVRAVWSRWREEGLAPGSELIEIPGGDHRLLDHLDRIAEEILRALRRFPSTRREDGAQNS